MRSHLLVVSALSTCAILAAQSVPQVKKTAVTATSPASGREMYIQYCASCHGKDAKGGGPAAVALKVAPIDLTTLTSHNNGKFPDIRIARLIEGSDDLAAHGSREMPIWGEVFHQMDGSGASTTKLRVANLTGYLQSIQGK
jgi:mono/diheme cytochrome c family protein